MNSSVLLKAYKDMWREKTFVLVLLLIFFVIVSLSLLIAVTAFIFNPDFLIQDPVTVGYVGVVIPESPVDKLSWELFSSEEEAMVAFDNSLIDAVVIPRVTTIDYYDIILPMNPVKQSLVSGLLRDHFHNEEDVALQNSPLGVITPLSITTQNQPVRGIDVIFEVLFGFALPLFLLIPAFLLGNLFIDMISEEFERKQISVLFTAINPLHYVSQIFLFGLIINAVLVLMMMAVMYLRFSFLVQFFSVFMYVLAFFIIAVLLALIFVMSFENKTPAQLSYSFSVLSLFLFAPYISWLPVQKLSGLLLGLHPFSVFYFAGMLILAVVMAMVLRLILRKKYYI